MFVMTSVATMILTILAILVMLIFVGCIYAFFYAIFTFIFSAGDDDKIKKAWNSIRYMVLGIILTLAVLFIFPIVLKKAKVPGYEYYTASNIFSQVSFLSGGFLNLGKEAVDQYQQGSINPGGPVENPGSSTTPRSSSAPGSADTYEGLEL